MTFQRVEVVHLSNVQNINLESQTWIRHMCVPYNDMHLLVVRQGICNTQQTWMIRNDKLLRMRPWDPHNMTRSNTNPSLDSFMSPRHTCQQYHLHIDNHCCGKLLWRICGEKTFPTTLSWQLFNNATSLVTAVSFLIDSTMVFFAHSVPAPWTCFASP